MNKSFPRAFLFCIFPVMFILTGSLVFAIETLKVSPASLNLKKDENKSLTLTGKNLSKAKSALVFQKNSPKKEFTTKLTCKGTTRCVVSLTLKGQTAPGGYSVKLFDAKKKLIAVGVFKLNPPAGAVKVAPKTSRSLRSKPKQAPPVAKATPRSTRELKSKSKQAAPSVKAAPKSSRTSRSKSKKPSSSVAKTVPLPSQDIKPKTSQTPPASKILPRSSRDLRAKPKQVPAKGKTVPRLGKGLKLPPQPAPLAGKRVPRSDRDLRLQSMQTAPAGKAVPRSRLPESTRVNPSVPTELASITLVTEKAAPGEIVKGTIFLTEKAPSPRGVRIELSSSDSNIAMVRSVQIPAGKNNADFTINTGTVPGPVKITAKLGITLYTSLVVEAPTPFSPFTIDKGTFQMTGRRFNPVTVDMQKFKLTGKRFAPVTVDMQKFKLTGKRFAPVTVDIQKFKLTGKRFDPVTIDKGTFQMTGRRGETAEAAETPPLFSPVTIDPGTFQVTGRRFNPVTIDPGTFEVTGRRFNPVVIDPGTFQVTGRRGELAQNQ
jgi:hypothetical protein